MELTENTTTITETVVDNINLPHLMDDRLQVLENWVIQHERVKGRHEGYMMLLATFSVMNWIWLLLFILGI